MCLAFFVIGVSGSGSLFLASNRDEAFDRPTAPLAFWPPPHSHVLGGRDLVGGGTWLGITDCGRWTLITNVRDDDSDSTGPRSEAEPPPPVIASRGGLTFDFLCSGDRDLSPLEYLTARVVPVAHAFAGFNLVVGDAVAGTAAFFTNRDASGAGPFALQAGVMYGLSNAALDTPWPKVERGKAALRALLGPGGELSLGSGAVDRVLGGEVLGDAAVVDVGDDALLPSTGLERELERSLSSAFVLREQDRYGTRASSVVRVAGGECRFTERVYFLPSSEEAAADQSGQECGEADVQGHALRWEQREVAMLLKA